MPELTPAARDVVEAIAVACIVLTTLYKLASLYHHTKHWNGLGKALRDEKWAYATVFLWLILKNYVPLLDSSLVFLALAVWVITVEIRTARYIPRVTIWHRRL